MGPIDINSTDYWTGLLSGLSLAGVVWLLKLALEQAGKIGKPPLVFGRLTCTSGESAGVLRHITYHLQVSNRDTTKPARIEALFNYKEAIPFPEPLLVEPGGNASCKIREFKHDDLPSSWQRPYKMQMVDSEGRKWPIAMDPHMLKAVDRADLERQTGA